MAGFLSSKKTVTINLVIMTRDKFHCQYMTNFLLTISISAIFPSHSFLSQAIFERSIELVTINNQTVSRNQIVEIGVACLIPFT